MGLNSTLSSYSQSRSKKKGGGGNVGRLPGNWLVSADLDLTGFSDPRSNWAFPVLVLFMSSLESLVTYPSYSAIVHWIGCISAIK